MELVFQRGLFGTKVSMEVPDLEEILEKTPNKIEYEPHNNGFYLENDVLSLNYTAVHFGGRDYVDLWFKETEPKVNVSSDFTRMNRIPASLLCDCITAHQGVIGTYFIPLEEEKIGDTISANRYVLHEDDEFTVPAEWFDKGTRLLKQAAGKYNLKSWYKDYTRKQNSLGKKPDYNLKSRIIGLTSRILSLLSH